MPKMNSEIIAECHPTDLVDHGSAKKTYTLSIENFLPWALKRAASGPSDMASVQHAIHLSGYDSSLV